ncbi:Hypothetical predicted protein [Mytilus galloprovincialis]|uniref:Reverse transcriptase domain-containing protein n=1 Tax=Mytilus galloprovincialis TaxID=29158 RepID=A0A8B6F0K2_MYTGA|nr:Hypothetical predicted protein [Mytilus galloprovincialis]
MSKPFPVQQGVRQGGILSTELYKVYINDVLDQLENSGLGTYIGNIYCGSPTCADDVALIANSPNDLQTMISTVENYSMQEKYSLQPTKSVILKHEPPSKDTGFNFKINNIEMNEPDSAVHIGIKHSSDLKKKLSAFTLMKTSQRQDELYNKHLEPLEVFYRKSIKQILSLPNNTADAAIYTIAGVIPLQGIIHKAALNIYNKICGMESSVEKDLAERQLSISGFNSKNWFSKIRCLLAQYNLQSAHELIQNPVSRYKWKASVKKAVDNVWHEQLRTKVSLFSSLRNLSANNILWHNTHPCLASVGTSAQDISRLQPKLKLLTGTYYLQSNKAAFNQNSIDPTCLLCNENSETVEHFILDCKPLNNTRIPYLHELDCFLRSIKNCDKCFNLTSLVINKQLILDPSRLLCACGCRCKCMDNCFKVEYINRKLCYALHTKRNELLKALPSNKRLFLNTEDPCKYSPVNIYCELLNRF